MTPFPGQATFDPAKWNFVIYGEKMSDFAESEIS